MFEETLYPKTKQVLDLLTNFSLLPKFYLAGGTALALQLNHRKSSDLDFFTAEYPNNDYLIQQLHPYEPSISQVAPGTLDTLINETKVSFLEYTYPLLEELIPFRQIKLASVLDIACMKITAISSRGSKKDFIDLYTILERMDLEAILTAFTVKYKGAEYNKMHILKSLTYFVDAESDPDPDYMQPTDWEHVKKIVIEKVDTFTKKII